MPSIRSILLALMLLFAGATFGSRLLLAQPPALRAEPTEAQADFTPRDRRLQGHLEQVQRELDDPQADHRASLESLQQLIDQAEDVFTDATMGQSVRERVFELLSTLPEPTAKLYEETFGPAAQAVLQSAELDPHQARQEAVRRYFATAAGADAAWQLAVARMDRGDLLGAARLLETLQLEHRLADRYEPQLSMRAAVSYWRGGEEERAAQVLLRAAQGDPDLRMFDQSLGPVGSEQEAVNWLARQLGEAGEPQSAAAPEWLNTHGSRTRNRSVEPVSPLYDDAWSVPLIGLHDADEAVLVEELLSLLDGVSEAGGIGSGAAVPALSPIVVGDLVVFASYGQVKAVELDSGRIRWVALPADHTYSDLLSATAGAAARRLPDEMSDFLMQRAWLDRTSSRISSDGERVYAVRDAGMIGGVTAQPFNPVLQLDHPRQARSYNALRAYDAAGGSWLWELGGPRTRVAAPLAGTYFLGPPLAVDGTLYVLGEDLGQVRLHALEPRSGEPLWSVPLANADADIDADFDRRLAGLSPTLAGGLLICPTGSGLVVAVDPLTRSVQWGTQYRKSKDDLAQQQFRRGGPFLGLAGPQFQDVTVEDLLRQSRWEDSCVVAAGSALLVATPDVAESGDQQRLLCLDLFDGSTRWHRERQDALYVGGVCEQTLLLVGSRQVEGVSLVDGTTHWSLPIDEPCGRGVLSGSLYHIPLSGGEVATLDVAQPRLLARSAVRSGSELGNLIAVDGRIISLSPTEVRSFRRRADVLEQIAGDLQQRPDAPEALSARGELRLHAGELDAGMADLRQALSMRDDPRARQLLVTVLLEGLRSDFSTWRMNVEELERLAQEPPLRSRFLRMYAEGLVEAGETAEGFRQYLRLLALNGPDSPLEFVEEGRHVRRDRRILGELMELYAAADAPGRAALKEVIAAESAAVPAASGELLLSRLSAAIPDLQLPEADALPAREAGDEIPASEQEGRLLAARRDSPREQQGRIAAQLVELYAAHGRVEPVVTLLQELESVWAEQPCLDELTGAAWAEQARQREAIAGLLSRSLSWPAGPVHVREAAGQANPFAPLRREGPFDPVVSPFIFLPDNRNHLAIHDGYGRPIREGVVETVAGIPASFSTQYVMQRGHRALVFQGTHFKLIDLMDGTPRVVLAEVIVDGGMSEMQGLRFTQRTALRQQGFRGTMYWSQEPSDTGSVGPLNDSIFCYQRGSTLSAHDPFNGARLWSVENAPHGSEIFADEHFVLLVPGGQNVAHVYRSLDGAKLGTRALPPDVVRDRRGADWGRYFLRLTRGAQTHRLAMYDPVAQEDLWQKEVSPNALWTPRDGYDLCLVDPETRRLSVLDPLEGEVEHEFDVDLPDRVRSIAILSLPDQWLLTTYRPPLAGDMAQLAATHGMTSAIAVNGPVTAVRRHTAQTAWSRGIASQVILPEFPSRWPVLPLSATLQAAARTVGGRPIPVMTRRVELIDLATGATLHTAQSEGAGNMRTLDVYWNVEETPPHLRLQYGQIQLEISFGEAPADQPPAAEPAAAPPPRFPQGPPPPPRPRRIEDPAAPPQDGEGFREFRRDAPAPPPPRDN